MWKDRFKNAKGVASGIISAFFYALGAIQVKFVQHDVTFLQVLTIRGIFITTVTVPFLLVRKEPFFLNDRWIWFSSILDSLVVFFQILAFINMASADASAIFFSQPAFVGILGFVFFKERCGVLETVMTILAVLGVLMIVQPTSIFDLLQIPAHASNMTIYQNISNDIHHILPESNITSLEIVQRNDSTEFMRNVVTLDTVNRGLQQHLAVFNLPRWQASIVAVVAAILSAMGALCIRRCTQSGHGAYTLIFQFKTTGSVCFLLLLFICGDFYFPYTYMDCLYLLVAGIGNWLGNIFYFIALKWENPSIVSISRTTEILFAYVLQIILITAKVNIFSIFGTIIITFTACTTGLLSLRRGENQNRIISDEDIELNEQLLNETRSP
jgi:drug/metabolite transporter (DMT)-like permease